MVYHHPGPLVFLLVGFSCSVSDIGVWDKLHI